MKKLVIVLSAVILTACVPQSKYKELEQKYYAALQGESKSQKEISEKEALLKSLGEQYSSLQEQQDALARKKAELDAEYSKLQKEYEIKMKDMEALKNKNSEAQKEREKVLGQLEQTKGELQEKIKRIDELEALIALQKEAVSELKNRIQNALKGYEGKGITVVEKNGNIYISMENKLLFASGSWIVQMEGVKAINDIASVLSKDSKLNIVIQGHTDNVRYDGKGEVKDNWDLSVMRATSITKILQDEGVSPTQMTAAGRSEYDPVASNNSAEGKATNRRVDIIIAPNLDEITKLLNEL